MEKEPKGWKAVGITIGGLLCVGFIQVVLWALAVHFLPAGWWDLAINVIGFLVTAVFIGGVAWRMLKEMMPSLLAWFLGFSIWFIMVVLVRPSILDLLDLLGG